MGKGVVGEVKSQLEMLVVVVEPGTGWSSMYLQPGQLVKNIQTDCRLDKESPSKACKKW